MQGAPDGNCHQYAVASLLGIDPDTVPHFPKFEDWRKEYIAFMQGQGYAMIFIPIASPAQLSAFLKSNRFAEADVLIAVKSFRHDGEHLVVGKLSAGKIEIVFDPNPNNQDRKIEDYTIREIDIPINSCEGNND